MRAFLLLIVLLAALSARAAAPLTFEEVDTDGDGLISADEAANVEGLDFNAADGDNDGTLSVDEYDIALENLSPPDEEDSPINTDTAKLPESAAPASPDTNATDTAQPAAPTTAIPSSIQADVAKPVLPANPTPPSTTQADAAKPATPATSTTLPVTPKP